MGERPKILEVETTEALYWLPTSAVHSNWGFISIEDLYPYGFISISIDAVVTETWKKLPVSRPQAVCVCFHQHLDQPLLSPSSREPRSIISYISKTEISGLDDSGGPGRHPVQVVGKMEHWATRETYSGSDLLWVCSLLLHHIGASVSFNLKGNKSMWQAENISVMSTS